MTKREDAEQTVIDEINRRFGPGTIMWGDSAPIENVQGIPTGSYQLDKAIGIGGIPRGRITEIFSWESMGKSTLCQHIVGNTQRMGLDAAYIDMEHSLDPDYAALCGVDYSKLLVSQPDNGDAALEIVEALIRSKKFGVIIVDSVSALVPKNELEGDMGDATMGKLARLMSQALMKINPSMKSSKTALVFANQKRYRFVQFGNP